MIAHTMVGFVAVCVLGGCSAHNIATVAQVLDETAKGRISPPTVIKSRLPVYPERAVAEGLEGSLEFIVVIAADGSVLGVRSQTWRNTLLEEAGRHAIITWELSPTLQGGFPTTSWAYQTITFTLDSETAGENPATEAEALPRLMWSRAAEYPMVARKAGVEGTVFVEVTLDENAQVIALNAPYAEPPGIFEEAAVECVRSWRFAPPENTQDWKGGKSTQVIEFILDRNRQPLHLGGFRLEPITVRPESLGGGA